MSCAKLRGQLEGQPNGAEGEGELKIGAMIFATDQSIKMTRLAPELEIRGFESLWLPEKTHLPVSRKTPWPGGELPEWYKRTLDPWVALAAAAAVTSTLRVGTGVLLVPVHDPVILAKAVASLDWQSEGRFEFGIGYGWNVEEYVTHGVDLVEAPAILRDKMALMQELWTHEIGRHEGEYVRVEPCWSWPKPIGKARPPTHLGARASQAIFRDIASYADGWIPIEGYGDILEQIPRLRDAFEAEGRSRDEALVSVYASSGELALLEEYQKAGVHRVIVSLPSADESEVFGALDTLSKRLSGWL